jgi:monoterpene epsilon-lactone hydrolase
MTSNESREFSQSWAALRERMSDPDLDLATIRDIVETVHIAAKEPEGVTYAEVDAGGVEALWCVPANSEPRTVLLHNHMGGSVVTSMHCDRKPAAHIAKAAGMRSLVVNYRRSPEHKFPAQIEDVEKAYDWLLGQGYRAENIASVGHSFGGNLAVSLALKQVHRHPRRCGHGADAWVAGILPIMLARRNGRALDRSAGEPA